MKKAVLSLECSVNKTNNETKPITETKAKTK